MVRYNASTNLPDHRYERVRMNLVPNVSFFVLLVAALTSGLVSLLLWRRRRISGGTALAYLMSFVTLWTLAAALEAGASNLPAKLLLSRLEYVGSGGAAYFLLMFALQHAGMGDRLTRGRRAMLGAIPILSVGLAFTNDWHRLLWTGFSAGPEGSHQLIYHHGPIFFAIVATLYTLIVPATIVLARTAMRQSIADRRRAVAVLAAIAAPWVGTILYLIDIDALAGFNLVPMSFAVSGLFLSFSIAGLRHFDVVPIARSALLDDMKDAVLVLDTSGRIADANASAKRLLAAPEGLVGRPADRALAGWPSIFRHCRGDTLTRGDAVLDRHPRRIVDVQATPLRDRRRRLYGRMVVLRDITPRVDAERKLHEVNERLQEQLREIEGLHRELHDRATRDPLTELYNRRYLEETLPREIARSSRDEAPLALLLLDIDRFKEINDRAGHPAGDEVLRTLGNLLRLQTRKGDIACRYGGDEFAVALPNTSLETAIARADEIRMQFAEQVGSVNQTSLSIGVSVFPLDGRHDEDILKAADRALYKAKASGKDCVRTAQDL